VAVVISPVLLEDMKKLVWRYGLLDVLSAYLLVMERGTDDAS
jgi:hypothetical protein